MKQKFDAIVVGGGILGVAHAYHLLKMGFRVALFERNRLPLDASVRNFGQIVPSGFAEKWQKYGRKSLDIYNEIQKQYDISAKQEGSLYIASDEDEMTLLEELSVINLKNDYTSRLLTQGECLERIEGLKKSYVVGGLHFPQEICLNPRVAVARIIRYCEEMLGLSFFSQTLVNCITEGDNGIKVGTAVGQEFEAKKCFVCNGIDFETLFPESFNQSEIEIVKLQMMMTAPQKSQILKGSILTGLSIRRYESFQDCPSYQEIKSREDINSFEKRHGVHILLKQNPDGSIILGDSHHYASIKDRDQLGFDQNEEVNNFMLREVQKIIDLEDSMIQQTWLGFYSQCKHHEIFNKVISPNIHINTAIGGKGMTASFGYAEDYVNSIF